MRSRIDQQQGSQVMIGRSDGGWERDSAVITSTSALAIVALMRLGVVSPAQAEPPGRATLDLHVTDADSGRGLPCRMTIVDRQGVGPSDRRSRRTAGGPAGRGLFAPTGPHRVGLAPGDYTVYATRGFEYGLDRREVSVADGQDRRVELAIRREVPTPGLVACDTHIHTLTLQRPWRCDDRRAGDHAGRRGDRVAHRHRPRTFHRAWPRRRAHGSPRHVYAGRRR